MKRNIEEAIAKAEDILSRIDKITPDIKALLKLSDALILVNQKLNSLQLDINKIKEKVGIV